MAGSRDPAFERPFEPLKKQWQKTGIYGKISHLKNKNRKREEQTCRNESFYC